MSLVLIAEDEEPTLEILSQVVEDLGYRVLQAHDGHEALGLARAHRPDLVITDYMMPRMSGIDLMRTLRQEAMLAATPIVLISAARPDAAGEATQFLGKPLDLDEFESLLRRLIVDRPERDNVFIQAAALEKAQPHLREEMLNWVAHEVRTPLSAARMSAELVRRRLAQIGDARDQQHVRILVRQLDRMTELITSVLDAANLREGKLSLRAEPNDLNRLVERVVALFRDVHPGTVFELRLSEEPLILPIDELRVQQILDNMLSNAVKYGGGSAPVSIAVERGRSASVSVGDKGPGIAADDLPHLFDRFHRGLGIGNSDGHGLGLYIASSLARLHGGSLAVRSELGRGSTFTLTLPLGDARG